MREPKQRNAPDSSDPSVNDFIDEREYTLSDQQRFAEISGDFNPIHLDPARARREIFGEVVVHGVHALLRALDAHFATWLEEGIEGVALRKLAAKFPNPIPLQRRVETFRADAAHDRAALSARAGGLVVLEADVQWAVASRAEESNIPASPAAGGAPTSPDNPTFEEIASLRGSVQLYASSDAVSRTFPALAALLPRSTIAELLALTRLVGMECPGLRSTFSGFEVTFPPAAAPSDSIGPLDSLHWKVGATDSRFSFIKLEVKGPSLEGVADTFQRPAPQKQPGMAEVQRIVRPGEFEGQCALVVGGSRGLGEVTARIVTAGGGQAYVSYYRGREDTEALAEEARRAGGSCEAFACDVADPEPALEALHARGAALTHVYYFASPKIFVSKPAGYDAQLFHSFAACYVDGLAALHRALRRCWRGPLALFNPSSAVLDQPSRQLAEYAAAKAAGEALCAQLDRFDSKLSVLVKRLPRIATDQTLTLGPYPAANALDVMVEIVRELHERPH